MSSNLKRLKAMMRFLKESNVPFWQRRYALYGYLKSWWAIESDYGAIARLDLRPEWAKYLPKRYVVFPGYVHSKNDGDHHYIDADQLMSLYRVKRSECLVVRDERDRAGNRRMIEALIPLNPRFNGDYELPVRPPWRPTRLQQRKLIDAYMDHTSLYEMLANLSPAALAEIKNRIK